MSIHIFTEVIRCGEIGDKAIQSFREYHPDLLLHVYCGEDDVAAIPAHTNNIIHIIPKDSDIYKAFDNGHLGTSKLWTDLIVHLPDSVTHLIHFDSDVVFLGDAVHDIINGLKDHDLVGPIRNYINNPNNRDDERYLKVVQTYCFGFNRTLITQQNTMILQNWVSGFTVQYPHRVIDFFDPVSFHILYNGGKPLFMDANAFGGTTIEGKRNNKHEELNSVFDVGDKIIHFSSVGLGLNFYKMLKSGKQIPMPQSYVGFAMNRFDIYSQLYFNNRILNNNDNTEITNKMRAFLTSHASG